MLVFPNAKINLGLNILAKRNDGFHDIATVFYPIGLSDILEISESETGKVEWVNTGLTVDCEAEKNLVVKAYQLLNEQFNLPAVTLHLHKVVPFGAGLGGGSADAAFALVALNAYFSLGLSKAELAAKAACLGSDCAFFVYNEPCVASGRGEILSPIELSLKGKHILLLTPEVHVSTATAYAGVTPNVPQLLPSEIVKMDISQWKHELKNDFEASVFQKFPELKYWRDKLYDEGAVYASMSGSGSSLFGIFDRTPPTLEATHHCFVWQGELK